MLLPHRLYGALVARVAGVMLPEQAVGSIWTPSRLHDPNIAGKAHVPVPELHTRPAVACWGQRDNRKPSYPSFSLDTLRSLPVPNFATLGAAERDLLSSWFDWVQNETLQPFPRMHEDPCTNRYDAEGNLDHAARTIPSATDRATWRGAQTLRRNRLSVITATS